MIQSNRNEPSPLSASLLIVATVGILALIALPEYRAYTMRAKVSRVIAATEACRSEVAAMALFGNQEIDPVYHQMIAQPMREALGRDLPCETLTDEARKSQHVGQIMVMTDGSVVAEARIAGTLKNSHDTWNGLHLPSLIALVPYADQGKTPYKVTDFSFSRPILAWGCGASGGFKREWLPSECRSRDISPHLWKSQGLWGARPQ